MFQSTRILCTFLFKCYNLFLENRLFFRRQFFELYKPNSRNAYSKLLLKIIILINAVFCEFVTGFRKTFIGYLQVVYTYINQNVFSLDYKAFFIKYKYFQQCCMIEKVNSSSGDTWTNLTISDSRFQNKRRVLYFLLQDMTIVRKMKLGRLR